MSNFKTPSASLFRKKNNLNFLTSFLTAGFHVLLNSVESCYLAQNCRETTQSRSAMHFIKSSPIVCLPSPS